MTDETLTELSPGTTVAHKYRLLRPLAAGGMGAVWVAQHLQLDTHVAIKFMDPSLADSSTLRTRFEREAKAAAQLKTRHVVQVLDHGVDEDMPYIVMELLDGEDLRTRLKRRQRLSLEETASLLHQAAKGLRLAHEAGIVHRDLKPANVFLTHIDDEEVVKLLDFGVAKMASGTHDGDTTSTGVVVGSPNYMSPEQARSTRCVDWRSDLWSLAVVAFRCATGQSAFRGETTADVLVKICAEPIPVPSQLAPDLPPAIDTFFERALARDPEQRFQTATEMAEAFAGAVTYARTNPAVWPPGASEPEPSTSGVSPSFGSQPLFGTPASAGGLSPRALSPAAPAPPSHAEARADDAGEDDLTTALHTPANAVSGAGTLTQAGAITGAARPPRSRRWLTVLVGALLLCVGTGIGALAVRSSGDTAAAGPAPVPTHTPTTTREPSATATESQTSAQPTASATAAPATGGSTATGAVAAATPSTTRPRPDPSPASTPTSNTGPAQPQPTTQPKPPAWGF